MTETRKNKGTVYLIHFEQKLCHAQHYIGWSNNLSKRLHKHANGNGARLMQVIMELDLGWTLARVWIDQNRRFERRLKNNKNAKRLCPVCSGQAAYNRMKGE